MLHSLKERGVSVLDDRRGKSTRTEECVSIDFPALFFAVEREYVPVDFSEEGEREREGQTEINRRDA